MRRFAFFSALVCSCLAALGGLGARSQPSPSSAASANGTGAPDIIAQITGDMLGTNEGHPHGIPSDWRVYVGPSISDGNRASTSCKDGGPCGAIDYWGTIYMDASGNASSNTRVNVKHCQAAWISGSTGEWKKWGPDPAPEAMEDYPENFDGPTTPTNVRTEPDKSISILPASGRTSHFYGPYPRIPIESNHLAGVVTACEMRLVVDNPAGPDDRASARLLGNVGGDYYPSPTGPGILNNPGIGGGKFKYIRTEWRSFAMTTLTKQQLERNPPPITFAGSGQ